MIQINGLSVIDGEHGDIAEHIYVYDVTEKAQQMVGYLVKKAKLSVGYYFGDTDDREDKNINYIRSAIERSNHDDTIDFDGERLFIEFSNGAKVVIGSSEWGHFEKCDFNF